VNKHTFICECGALTKEEKRKLLHLAVIQFGIFILIKPSSSSKRRSESFVMSKSNEVRKRIEMKRRKGCKMVLTSIN
jgi:hypothetical protein